MNFLFGIVAVFLAAGFPAAEAQQAAGVSAPQGFTAIDTPNDAGKSVSLIWNVDPSDGPGVSYVISVATDGMGPWTDLPPLESTKWFKSDQPQYFGQSDENKKFHFFEFNGMPGEDKALETGKPYYFRIRATDGTRTVEAAGVASAAPKGNWFNTAKVNILVFTLFFCAVVIGMIQMARRNPRLFIRRIPGLDAMDEAIGRATEMGRSVLYLNGLYDMSSISTLASVSILGKVAQKIARFDSQIKVPCYDPIVMSVCQEVVREAYTEAGRPDAFRQDNIFFLTNDQFGYVAAVDGIMLRERPAANLYFGYYFAESLLLAETGATTGAIQIAGTDSVTQLPFFIVTCDYTLMGEELYAASAYLSREPLQLGSIKGQDAGKAFIAVMLIAGALMSTFGIDFVRKLFETF
jgi:hypothetical protein